MAAASDRATEARERAGRTVAAVRDGWISVRPEIEIPDRMRGRNAITALVAVTALVVSFVVTESLGGSSPAEGGLGGVLGDVGEGIGDVISDAPLIGNVVDLLPGGDDDAEESDGPAASPTAVTTASPTSTFGVTSPSTADAGGSDSGPGGGFPIGPSSGSGSPGSGSGAGGPGTVGPGGPTPPPTVPPPSTPPGPTPPPVVTPPPAMAQCEDGIDNDGDGWIDWPADPGCANSEDDFEGSSVVTPPPPPPTPVPTPVPTPDPTPVPTPDPTPIETPVPDTDGDGWIDTRDECLTVPAGLVPDPLRPGCPLLSP